MLFHYLPIFLALISYLALGYISQSFRTQFRIPFLACLNVICLFFILQLINDPSMKKMAFQAFFLYLSIVCIHFFILRRLIHSEDIASLLPIIFPILFLILIRMNSIFFSNLMIANIFTLLIGISYVTFRLSYMSIEIRSRAVVMPSFFEYINFAFFVPIIPVGPITRYSLFRASMMSPSKNLENSITCISRIVIGATKFWFLSNVIKTLTFNEFLLNGNPHHHSDLAISSVAYYIFLYLNFSGFCDMAIGASGLLGFHIEENFNAPFLARNIKDFWNRWHITLSNFMRDILFTPLSKRLVQIFGANSLNFSIVLTIFTVFILIGLWHGFALNFLFFGLIHAFGVAFNYLMNALLKKHLSKESYKQYLNNRLLNTFSIVITFIYISFSFIFFANDMQTISNILGLLQ